jgi:hypothetical protein
MNMTAHFQIRSQQRAISPAMVDMILDLGESNAKGDLVLLGTKEIDQAIQSLNSLKRDLEKMRSSGGAGVAYNGDTLITTFRRYKKFKRG